MELQRNSISSKKTAELSGISAFAGHDSTRFVTTKSKKWDWDYTKPVIVVYMYYTIYAAQDHAYCTHNERNMRRSPYDKSLTHALTHCPCVKPIKGARVFSGGN